MKAFDKKHIALTLCLSGALAVGALMVMAGNKAPKKVYDLANSLLPMGTDPVIVQAVKEQNAKPQTPEAIQARQKRWAATEGLDPFMKAMLDSAISKHLFEIQQSKPYYTEVFLKDAQGCNVGMSAKTSNYWHGDKDKFLKCFTTGQPFVGDMALDESTQSYSSQISVPVKDGNKTIGVLILGIVVDQLK